ncbi:MAG: ABC transporter ATP-binding protein/permease [Lachnospiraceae bacterium]|nr:ABC transporter ATP-binding protein/permease [Lachnospiraceae bacterium]
MKNKRNAYYIFRFMQMDRKNTIFVLCLKMVSALLLSVETLMIAMLIDHIAGGIVTSQGRVICYDVVLLALFWLMKRCILFISGIYWAGLKRTVYAKLPSYVLEKKAALPYLTLEKKKNQELIRRIGTDTAVKFCAYFENVLSLVEIVIQVLGLLLLVVVRNVAIGCLLLLVMIPHVIYSIRNGQSSYEAYEKSEELFRRADYYQDVMKDRKYMEERTLFQFGNFFHEKWADKSREAIHIETKANFAIFARAGTINIFSTIVIGALSGLLLLTVVRGQSTVGFFISIMKSFINFIDTVSSRFAGKMSTYEKGVLFLQDINRFEYLDEEVTTAENIRSFDEVKIIEFRHVSFAYPQSSHKIFDDLSLKLTKDRQYALVGENGAGKSTLLKLIMGFYDDYTGEILINGIDIKSVPKETLRRLYSFVPQEITRYEVRLNEYLKNDDRNKIHDIFAEMGIQNLDMPDAFPLLGKIEDEGRDLSGGEWQLLAIARAMLDNRAIYVLDEPTAAIDPIREVRLYQLFQNMMRAKFTILVTHRLGAAKIADEIIVLKDGKIREKGSHDELMEQKGIYQSMYNTQRKWYEV